MQGLQDHSNVCGLIHLFQLFRGGLHLLFAEFLEFCSDFFFAAHEEWQVISRNPAYRPFALRPPMALTV